MRGLQVPTMSWMQKPIRTSCFSSPPQCSSSLCRLVFKLMCTLIPLRYLALTWTPPDSAALAGLLASVTNVTLVHTHLVDMGCARNVHLALLTQIQVPQPHARLVPLVRNRLRCHWSVTIVMLAKLIWIAMRPRLALRVSWGTMRRMGLQCVSHVVLAMQTWIPMPQHRARSVHLGTSHRPPVLSATSARLVKSTMTQMLQHRARTALLDLSRQRPRRRAPGVWLASTWPWLGVQLRLTASTVRLESMWRRLVVTLHLTASTALLAGM
eukprot:COSAG02_NODE_5661_length_4146_cov_38.400049_1_plen_268_part_00